MGKIVAEFAKNALETVRISISEFRGKTYGDIRVYYRDDDGELKPSRKGLTLAPDLIPDLRAAVVDLEKAFVEDGLCEPEEEE